MNRVAELFHINNFNCDSLAVLLVFASVHNAAEPGTNGVVDGVGVVEDSLCGVVKVEKERLGAAALMGEHLN